MKRRTTITILAVVLAAVTLCQVAVAGGRTYVDRRRTIRAGVLTPGTKLITSPFSWWPTAPYIFYVMDQREDLKPAGWSFMNPLAGGRDSFKNTEYYWEVPLPQVTSDNLAKFDILYLNAPGLTQFDTKDRDKLRKYVDCGGCLWVDNGGSMVFPSIANDHSLDFFLPDVNFDYMAAQGVPKTPIIYASLHSVLTSPFRLSPDELSSLDLQPGWINPGFTKSFTSLSTMPNPTTLSPIFGLYDTLSAARVTIAGIEFGSGKVLVTSGFIGGKIQGPVMGAPSDGFVPRGANLSAAFPSNLRFAYNVVNWGSSSTTLRKNYRHTGVSLENVGAPLLKKWKIDSIAVNPSSGGTATGTGGASTFEAESSPVVWKNIVFVTSGDTLYALDAVPEEDLDNDGNPDDGLPDPNFPTQDIIWKWSNNGHRLSSPTVASMIDPSDTSNITPRDFVLVTSDDDQLVHVFEALPGSGFQLSSVSPDRGGHGDMWDFPTNYTKPKKLPPLAPPVVQNGWIYAAGGDGILYGFCPVFARAASMSYGGPGPAFRLSIGDPAVYDAEIKFGLVAGYVKNRANGAVVENLSYVAYSNPTGSTPAPNDCIVSIPIFVSSDKLTAVNPTDLVNPTPGTSISFRTSYPELYVGSYPAPRVWAVDTQGRSVDVALDTSSGGGLTVKGQVKIISSGTNPLGPNVRVYMSYSLDYSQLNVSLFDYVPNRGSGRYDIEPTPTGGVPLQLSARSTPALGPNDAFYFGVNWPSASGTGKDALYSVAFEGATSQARLKWAYFLHGGGTFANPTYDPVHQTPAQPLDQLDGTHKWGIYAGVVGNDPNPVNWPKIPVPNLEIRGTPAVTNDRVFVTATTTSPPNGAPGGYLLCFKSDPAFAIRTNRSFIRPGSDDHMSVTIWQPDLLFSSGNYGDVSLLAVNPPTGINYDTGTITITDFAKVRLQTYMSGTGTSLIVPAGTITPSLPVWVFLDGTPIPLDQIDFSSWDNLVWALPLQHADGTPSTGATASPVVMGDYVYFVDDQGYMFAVDVNAEPADVSNNTGVSPNMLPPNKVYRLLLPPLPPATDPNYNDIKAKWDAAVPMRSKIDAASGPGGKSSIAGAGGMVVAPTTSGLYCLNNQLTLVTDNHRVMEVGDDGKIAWACDSIFRVDETTAVQNMPVGMQAVGIKPEALNKPLAAQKLGGNDYLVVDSGNDRVIRMDRGGQVLWSLKDFVDTNNILRSGEPKSLKDPSDARMWSEMEVSTATDGTNYYVVHCLVADTGNFRIVDIVDRFVADANGQVKGPELYATGTDSGQPIGHQLRWVSNTTYTDKKFTFNCIQLVRKFDNAAADGESPNVTETDKIYAAVSNYGLGTSSVPGDPLAPGGGRLGGAILALDYRKGNAGAWTYHDGKVLNQLTNLGGGSVSLAGPRYFSVIDPSAPKLLICDANAVYVTSDAKGTIAWQLTGDQYSTALPRPISGALPAGETKMRRIPFSPYRAQILADGRMLIVNSYAGRTNDPKMYKFTGEVFTVDYVPTSAANAPTGIDWSCPEVTVHGDPATSNWDIIQQIPNGPNLDQPTCAQRLY